MTKRKIIEKIRKHYNYKPEETPFLEQYIKDIPKNIFRDITIIEEINSDTVMGLYRYGKGTASVGLNDEYTILKSHQSPERTAIHELAHHEFWQLPLEKRQWFEKQVYPRTILEDRLNIKLPNIREVYAEGRARYYCKDKVFFSFLNEALTMAIKDPWGNACNTK